MSHFGFACPIVPLNAGLFVSPGYGTHATRVIDSYELIFVTQGSLDMFEEGDELHLEANQSLLLSPRRRHGGRLPYARDVNFYWIHFRTRSLDGTNLTVTVPRIATVRDPETITELFCRFISDQESGSLHPVAAAHIVSLMLCLVGGREGDGSFTPAGHLDQRDEIIAKIRACIDKSYGSPLSTEVIAKRLGYSADYLERVHRREEGVSILTAIHARRIRQARAFLRSEGRKNISEVAFSCGYSDPSYFRRVFKRFTGCTPRQFRVLYSRTHINTH